MLILMICAGCHGSRSRTKCFKLFRNRHDLAPRYLSHGFITVSDSHRYQTRGSSFNYFLSKVWSMAPSSFRCTSIQLWNSLPNELKQIEVLRVFKQMLKMYLLLKYHWSGWYPVAPSNPDLASQWTEIDDPITYFACCNSYRGLCWQLLQTILQIQLYNNLYSASVQNKFNSILYNH